MGELISEFGDLVFSLVIGYIGAIEFLYVVRHLYHWSFNHEAEQYDNDDESLAHLQENMRNQLANASDRENKAGTNVMHDGVQYKDGFRIDPMQAEIDKLKEKLKDKELKDLQRKELEKELAKLQKIAEQTRKDLEKAEAAKRKEEEENARRIREAEEKREREQRKREEEQARKEAEENARKLAELEKQRELEQKRKEEEEEQKRKEAEENARKLAEIEKQRELEQKRKEEEEEQKQKEAEENNRKLVEAEKQKELEQKRKEEEEQLKQKQEAEENAQRLAELERQREEAEQQAENERQLLEAERLQEEQQRHFEEQQQEEDDEENERKYLELEHKLEEQLRAAEQEADLTEKEKQLIESIKQREIAEEEHNEQKEAELLRRILEAREQLGEESEEEQSLRLIQREQDHEAKQRRIEENALLFLEAEKEMAKIQQHMQEAVEKRVFASNLDSAPQTPIEEELCVKKMIAPLLQGEEESAAVSHRVKTQLAQDFDEQHSVSSKPLLFPGVSDEGSSIEPTSSQQSSFSTQPSEEVTTGTESHYPAPPQQERQEPDGEDTTPSLQYSEDYLRSLDGIKQRPLIREDGSGRRRAFKKRRSSNSSNSSRESRTSRDEELKMFTSLEEEEMKTTGDSEFTPIRYTSEPTLKVKGHHRRHKRSPAKDMKSDESLRSSLERLGEETGDPWGEVKPEPYKNTEFWKREKTLSIDEEMEFERPASSEEVAYDTATNMPSASSFEEATQIQNEQALTALRQQASKEKGEDDLADAATFGDESTKGDNKTNLQTSQTTEREASPARSSASPSLRRSPRIGEINQYEERWKESHEDTTATSPAPKTPNTPSITVQTPLDFAPWRDEHGLMMQGLSDFYDFQASVNPSRSRNNSRNPSPANTAPNTPLPKDVKFDLEIPNAGESLENTVEIYDDTDALDQNEFKKENIIKFIDSLNENEPATEEVEYELSTNSNESSLEQEIKYVMDDLSKGNAAGNSHNLVPMVNIIDESSFTPTYDNDSTQDDMNSLVATLRTQRSERSRSRSRSKSPLPTPGNLQRSLETRRNKMIRHNEDVLEKLIETKLLPETPPAAEEMEEIYKENINSLVDSLRTQRSTNSSRSRSRSPLPTPANIERSLEHRRNKRIQDNDELFEKLSTSDQSRSQSPVILNDSFDDKEVDLSQPEREEEHSDDNSSDHMESLAITQLRSRSKSPMRLPTADNLNKSIDSRRNKLIERNDECQKQLDKRSNTPESPNLTVEYVFEFETSSSEITDTVTQSETSSQVPTISIEFDEPIDSSPPKDEDADDCSREQMDLLVQSLRVARSRSRTPVHRRSRSKSPMRFDLDNNDRNNDSSNATTDIVDVFERSEESICQSQITINAPTIFIQNEDSDQVTTSQDKDDSDDCSREKMNSLVQSLRAARSRSRSKTPMRLPTADNLGKSLDTRRQKLIERNDELQQHLEERAKTPEPPRLSVEYVYEFENAEESGKRSRHSRSKSPSRSHSKSPRLDDRHRESRTPSRSLSPSNDFNVILNLEGSHNKTLSKNSEELESLKLQRQKLLDQEALEQLKNASEEMELRTLSPLAIDLDELNEQQSQDYLADLPLTERSKILRKSPTTPDYERTISEEMRDVERIKQDMIDGGFKRSTYVGESLDMGSEYEPLRREAAHFQRSQSPSPSFSRTDEETAKLKAEEKRKIQDMILAELTGSSGEQDSNQMRSTGAIRKTDRVISSDSESSSLSNEIQHTLKIRDEMLNSGFQRSTYVGESVDISLKYEEMRRRNAEFRRSASQSRSPLKEAQIEELAEIEKEASKRELQDKVLDEMALNNINFQEFSKHLNPEFFENDRRASDSALMQKPELLVQLQDNTYDSLMDMEPEEYHHYRRFSLAQEQQIEEYPNDDYIYIEKVEVRTRTGSRTWTREDFYSDDINDFLSRHEENPSKSSPEKEEPEKSLSDVEVKNDSESESVAEESVPVDVIEDDEDYSNNSDDDRQTVVEVDDEIDEDISDFKAEESHHDTSECEEADREMDRYAGRNASDWNQVVRAEEEVEGAVGGTTQSPYDSDSFAIDQIYDEAVKNRKQSGILREYDSILMQMSKSDIDEQYALWSKTQGKKPKNIEFNVSFLENERKDTEVRYLGDAQVAERKSVRLRSRYGYNPVLQSNNVEDDIEVDLNYKPKREYNWRKNFKLDEDDNQKEGEKEGQKDNELEDMDYNLTEEEQKELMEWEESNFGEEQTSKIDIRKYSLGGESITLFSRSPERSLIDEDYADNADNEEAITVAPTTNDGATTNDLKEEKLEKPKKKKTKKKSRKESRDGIEFVNKDEEDIPDSYIYSRRSSSIQMDTDSPKRKSRSRRSSKSSLTNDDASALFSPRSSVGYAEPIADIMEEYTESAQATARPKKIKKRKKVKETMANVSESPLEQKEDYILEEPLTNIQPISTIITPESSSFNILSILSPQNSVCVTPASIESEINGGQLEEDKESSENSTNSASAVASPTANSSRTSSITTNVDTFDILKDANFYPLF